MHFEVTIIAKNEIEAEELLKPYDESLICAPRIYLTKEEVIKESKRLYKKAKENIKDVKNSDQFRNYLTTFFEKHKILANLDVDSDKDDFDFLRFYMVYNGYSPLEFDENWNLLSTSNPNSQYDYYDFDGKWSDFEQGVTVEEVLQKFNELAKFNSDTNKFDLDDSFFEYFSYATLSSLGWFDEDLPEDEYIKKIKYILEKFKDQEYSVYFANCHI